MKLVSAMIGLLLLAFLTAGCNRPQAEQAVDRQPTAAPPASSTQEQVVYTCPMHPQVQQDKPGKCPICGMDLVKQE